jgi:reactive intermediate/imine deaminase
MAIDKQAIHSQYAPETIGPYSQAIQVANTVYLSGQIPLDPSTMTIVEGGFAEQAKQVFTNIETMCTAAGGNVNNIVKLTIYLIDLLHFPVVNEIMTQYFKPPYPARVTVQVSALPKAAQIEIDAILVV